MVTPGEAWSSIGQGDPHRPPGAAARRQADRRDPALLNAAVATFPVVPGTTALWVASRLCAAEPGRAAVPSQTALAIQAVDPRRPGGEPLRRHIVSHVVGG